MNLEDKVLELYNDLQQKEKLVAYFHSVIQPKQMQKIRPSTSQSTLISSSSDVVSIVLLNSQNINKLIVNVGHLILLFLGH
jgi:hypothetical protein